MKNQSVHVGLNAHLLSLSQSYRGAGISWYMVNLLKRLRQVAPDHFQFSAFLGDRGFEASGLTLQFSQLPTWRPVVRIFWEQVVQPVALRTANIDLLHALAFVAPLAASCPFVVTVYDLSFMRYPEAFRPFNRWYLSNFTANSVKRARAVITISESTRQDVIQFLGVSPARVHTIYCGADDSFKPLPQPEIAAFKAKHHLPDEFILFLGTLEPRKNVDGLIRAYAHWKLRDLQAPPLFIAGGRGWYYTKIFELVQALDLTGSVHFPGYVPQDDLPLWYNAAALFVYPSHFEGFGLPVLEAMACGTPVITSTESSLPEVAGESAQLVDPTDIEALADSMAAIMSQPNLRNAMREKGLVRAAQFKWEKTAAETVTVYANVMNHEAI